MDHSSGELREEHYKQKDSVFKGPEAGEILAHHGKSMRDLSQESDIISKENSQEPVMKRGKCGGFDMPFRNEGKDQNT